MKTKYFWSEILAAFFAFSLIFSVAGCSDGSDGDDENGSTGQSYAFSAPKNVSVSKSTEKANTATITWDAVDNAEITYY